jgi:hypothetical protein
VRKLGRGCPNLKKKIKILLLKNWGLFFKNKKKKKKKKKKLGFALHGDT